jgi:hypothetical protein
LQERRCVALSKHGCHILAAHVPRLVSVVTYQCHGALTSWGSDTDKLHQRRVQLTSTLLDIDFDFSFSLLIFISENICS